MPRIQAEALIAVNRDTAYHLAQDYTRRLEWDRFAERVRYDHGRVTSEVGFAGAAHVLNPFRMMVEHVSLAVPSLIAVNMLEGPKFIGKVKTSWRFESLDECNTKVQLECDFKSRWPIVRKLIDPLLESVFKRDARNALNDLKRALEGAQTA
ncbi:MAG: SRPBCC family protein [Agarilytica sp.]